MKTNMATITLFTGKVLGRYAYTMNSQGDYEVDFKGRKAIFSFETLREKNNPKPQFACKMIPDVKEKWFFSRWAGKGVTIDTTNLTEKETAVMIAARNNEYEDALNEFFGTWLFTVSDNAEGVKSGKSFSGVCSSLVKKGLVVICGEGTDSVFAFTEKGAKLFSDYDGSMQYLESLVD